MNAKALPTLDERRELCEKSVTLEGKPARICGARLHFPRVATLDGKHQGEWSWAAVQRVCDNGGHFML